MNGKNIESSESENESEILEFYEFKEKIGVGSFGKVHKAISKKTKEFVAIKV